MLSRDPIGLAGGANIHAYVGNDPVNATDPLGLATREELTWLAEMLGVGNTAHLINERYATIDAVAAGDADGAECHARSAADAATKGLVEIAVLGIAGGSGRRKPVGLPAWKKVTVDMPHILERHVPGARFAAGRTLFPSTMSENGIANAIRGAYGSSAKVGVQGADRILLRGQGGGLTIEMWFNKVTHTIETAYPVTP